MQYLLVVFFIQFEIFIVLCMTSDFLLKPEHVDYYSVRPWILRRLNLMHSGRRIVGVGEGHCYLTVSCG